MKQFEYVIKDPLGLHARPAGILVKEASKYQSAVKMANGPKSADAKRILGVMSLGIKCGDTVAVTVDGADEEKAAAELEKFFEQNV